MFNLEVVQQFPFVRSVQEIFTLINNFANKYDPNLFPTFTTVKSYNELKR